MQAMNKESHQVDRKIKSSSLMTGRSAIVLYPGNQTYTTECILKALCNWTIEDPDDTKSVDLQWCDYDSLDWDLPERPHTLTSSYAIRKGLIRKNHLAHTIAMYTAKHENSILSTGVPATYSFSIRYPDELDELLIDDLYAVEQTFDEKKTWILKPALADGADYIRLFQTREELYALFEELEEKESDLTEWICQDYIAKPYLFENRKFHLRVYVVAYSALKVYVNWPCLALLAGKEYSDNITDRESHLTNTCLQDDASNSVFLLDDILPESAPTIKHQIEQITTDLFKAALSAGSSFQPLPNAFEIFGLDFIVDTNANTFLLEVNACPDFMQTGVKNKNVIQNLFHSVVSDIINPHFDITSNSTHVSSLTKVLDLDCGL